MDEIVKKIEKLDERLASIDGTLIKQSASLDEHIRRTHLLEVDLKTLRADMKPVEQHVQQVKGGVKLISLVMAICTIALIITQIVR